MALESAILGVARNTLINALHGLTSPQIALYDENDIEVSTAKAVTDDWSINGSIIDNTVTFDGNFIYTMGNNESVEYASYEAGATEYLRMTVSGPTVPVPFQYGGKFAIIGLTFLISLA